MSAIRHWVSTQGFDVTQSGKTMHDSVLTDSKLLFYQDDVARDKSINVTNKGKLPAVRFGRLSFPTFDFSRAIKGFPGWSPCSKVPNHTSINGLICFNIAKKYAHWWLDFSAWISRSALHWIVSTRRSNLAAQTIKKKRPRQINENQKLLLLI